MKIILQVAFETLLIFGAFFYGFYAGRKEANKRFVKVIKEISESIKANYVILDKIKAEHKKDIETR